MRVRNLEADYAPSFAPLLSLYGRALVTLNRLVLAEASHLLDLILFGDGPVPSLSHGLATHY